MRQEQVEHSEAMNRADQLWRRTLDQVPTLYGRLVYLSSLRDPNTGIYTHYGFELKSGQELSRATIRDSHRRLFREWLNAPLERQHEDLLRYFEEISGQTPTLLQTWKKLGPYRNVMPDDAAPAEQQLFLTDLETLLQVLRNAPPGGATHPAGWQRR